MSRSGLNLAAPAVLALICVGPSALADTAVSDAGSPFWGWWSDGKAELDGYDLVQPRYGELRHGRATLIYVTEPFSRSQRVKVDRHDPQNPDHYVALKLNHVRRFSTGIYDYGLMTSLFVDPAQGFRPAKATFSAQEWCGHVYQELLFDPLSVANRVHSYFEGETQLDGKLEAPQGYVAADNLYIVLRSLASRELDTRPQKLQLLCDATTARLTHRPLAFYEAELTWSAQPQTVQVPAGSFEVREATWPRQDGVRCTAQLETAYPHRIVAWSCEDGEKAVLTGSTRLDYWRTHGEGDEKLLEQLGHRPMQLAP
jgi:hypothetical protein